MGVCIRVRAEEGMAREKERQLEQMQHLVRHEERQQEAVTIQTFTLQVRILKSQLATQITTWNEYRVDFLKIFMYQIETLRLQVQMLNARVKVIHVTEREMILIYS